MLSINQIELQQAVNYYRIVAEPSLQVTRHEHRVWSELAEGVRDELSRKNYRRFLDKWGDRLDLLVSSQREG